MSVALASRSTRAISKSLIKTYRTAEDYRRYVAENAARQKTLAEFYRKYRRYFGHSVLDLGCGGGVLAKVLEPTGRSYLGVDANPDMIKEARRAAKAMHSTGRFLLADIRRARIAGTFDTVTLLGNSLAHLSLSDLNDLLSRRSGNVHRGSTFLMDYRDLIAMFWRGSWTQTKVQTFVRGRVVHRATALDLKDGRLRMRARPTSGKWTLDWAHAIWSPFIMETLMRFHGWRLIRRSSETQDRGAKAVAEHYVEVYRFDPGGAALRVQTD
jgi:SAM-dependent methyltransferase